MKSTHTPLWMNGQAVSLAEGISGAKHPRIVPLLTLLATVFARTARVTVAEGMFRWAAPLARGHCSVRAGAECAHVVACHAAKDTECVSRPSTGTVRNQACCLLQTQKRVKI